MPKRREISIIARPHYNFSLIRRTLGLGNKGRNKKTVRPTQMGRSCDIFDLLAFGGRLFWHLLPCSHSRTRHATWNRHLFDSDFG